MTIQDSCSISPLTCPILTSFKILSVSVTKVLTQLHYYCLSNKLTYFNKTLWKSFTHMNQHNRVTTPVYPCWTTETILIWCQMGNGHHFSNQRQIKVHVLCPRDSVVQQSVSTRKTASCTLTNEAATGTFLWYNEVRILTNYLQLRSQVLQTSFIYM